MTKKQRRDLYRETTDRIIASLQSGVAPWVRPWSGTSEGMDRNGVSRRPYHGINVILTSMAGFSSRDWFTFNQARKLGGHVRKGEHGTGLVFFKPIVIKEEDPDTGEIRKKSIPLIKGFVVFNREQIEGLPEVVPVDVTSEPERDERCEAVLDDSGARINYGGNRAFYAPAFDQITLPPRSSFPDSGAFYATAFHELVHWTGADHRLARLEKGAMFGTPSYAAEELVAELGAAFLCAEYGVDGTLQHPEYIASWIKKLQDDSHAIFRASSLASKAVDFLHQACGQEEEQGEDPEEEGLEVAA